MVLRGLTPTRCSACSRRLRGRRCSWALAEAVHRQTEGNPLFVQEVVRLLVQEGALLTPIPPEKRTDPQVCLRNMREKAERGSWSTSRS